jgi:MFS family permease
MIGSVAGVAVLSASVVLPVFLTGALGFQMRSDLAIGVATLGGAVALFFFVTSMASSMAGHVVHQIGPRTGLTTAGLLSASALTMLATSQSAGMLFVALAVGGLGNSILHPSAAMALSNGVSHHRQALAFGVKQSSVPLSTMTAGLAIPAIALNFGWRATVGMAAVAALIAGVVLPRKLGFGRGRASHDPSPRPVVRPPIRALVLLGVGGGIGTMAGTAVGTFFVEGAIEAGLVEAAAGILFAVGSLTSIATRVWIGWAADRWPAVKRFRTVSSLLLVGSMGFVLLAVGGTTFTAAGALIAVGVGWGWTGLFNYLAVHDRRETAAIATGVVTTGLALGGGVGPLVFGMIVEAHSFSTGWWTMAVVCVAAAAVVFAYPDGE